jgi:transposase
MLLSLERFSGIYLYRDFVDFRKSIDGLAAIVSLEMAVELKEGNLFVFLSRRRDKMKILYFDRTGFALWYKRLEKEKFCWPRKLEDPVVMLSPERMSMLLDGIDVWKIRPHATLAVTQAF